MSQQISISGDITTFFNREELDELMTILGAEVRQTNDENQSGFWRINSVTIVLYKKKIVFQCSNSENNHEIISKVVSLTGINLNNQDKIKLASMSPKRQNAIVCKECYKPSLTILAEIEGLQIKFKKECTHFDEMNSPLFMMNYRLFPDINILVSRSLSRLIELGHFEGYEILIPNLVMNVIDKINLGTQKGAYDEVTALKNLETKGKIRVINFTDKYGDSDVEKYLSMEDNYLSDISDTTNSILITGDANFKSKVLLKNRPVIFIPPELHSNIKTMFESRQS